MTFNPTWGSGGGGAVDSVNGQTGVVVLDLVEFTGFAKITVGTTAPSSPSVGDLWIDTN